MRMGLLFIPVIVLFAANLGVGQSRPAIPSPAKLQEMGSRFAPTPLRVDIAELSSGDRQALAKLVEAARIFDDIFMTQLWAGNQTLYQRLRKDTSPLGRSRLQYFWINKGPWSELDEYKAFLPGVPPRKPLGANFYPGDTTKAQLETWISSLAPENQEKAKGFFTVVRWKEAESKRKQDRSLQMVPYNEEYKDELTRAAALLKDAAGLTDNASLKKFLTSRAEAFLSNDYYDSDMAWMDLDSPLDITIGPYETYTDELLGYKAAFEVYVNLRDEQESAKLSAFAKNLQEIEDHLPIDPKYRNPKLGTAAPIRVVDEIISGGDGAHGVQTAAYNLPNDERVVQQKGSKRVMIKNVQEAKFHSVLLPIARKTLSRSSAVDVNFESFFTHIVAHELMHGLGPQQIKVGDRDTTARQELKDLYGAIEEAKADVTGLFALQYMMDHVKDLGLDKVLPSDEAAQRQLYVTFLASAFRSLRFGLNDAHGKGMALQFNYLSDKGAFLQQRDGTFSVDMQKIKDAVSDLDHDLLTLEAEGNYDGARKMLDELGVVRPATRRVLGQLQGIPTDIQPIFVTADQVAPGSASVPADPPKAKKKRSRKRR
jgi:Peptidase family M49